MRAILRRHTVRLALWTLVIVAIVVPWRSLQTHPHWLRIRWVPFISPPISIGDIIGNVLLYVPFGYFAARSARNSWVFGLLSAMLLSCLTEATQIFGHWRFPSVQDILLNMVGTALGIFESERRRTWDRVKSDA